MPKKKIGPMNIYPLLPRTNCGKCPQKVCMSFAVQLCERNTSLEECPELFESQYIENLTKLRELLSPPVREVQIGNGDSMVRIGGELALRRHELRYLNPTAMAVVVDDDMDEKKILNQIKSTEEFSHKYIGMDLKLDMVAIRSKTKDLKRFEETVNKVAKATTMPLVLWSLDPEIIESGLTLVKERRPLLYSATPDNWKKMGEVALKYDCPLTIYAPNNIKLLRSLSKTLNTMGVEDLALDVGCNFGKWLSATIKNMAMIRSSAIIDEDKLLGYPLVGTPINMIDNQTGDTDEMVFKWEESCLASIMIVKYADLIMVSNPEKWTNLPLVMIRNNLYNDPRKPVSVEPGLRSIAEPKEDSPVFVTTNFALTYYTVMSDIENINNYLIVVDTEGISVESAVAGRKLTADNIADTVKSSNIEEKIRHKTMIIPEMAARLKGEIEDATKWDVMVGPRDSSGIPNFIKEKWEGKDHTPGWSYK